MNCTECGAGKFADHAKYCSAKRGRNPVNFREFVTRMLNAFPDATVETDNEGQLVIYTNLQENADGTVSEMEDYE